MLAVLYALCIVGPTAAIASRDDAAAVRCLTDGHLETVKSYVHQDGATHRHSAPDDDLGQPSTCCGLFSVNAVAPAIDFVVERQFYSPHVASFFGNLLFGRGSDRIDRPPRSLLSL